MKKNAFLTLCLFFSFRSLLCADDIAFKGNLVINELSYKASFELVDKGKKYSQLKITPVTSSSSCYFDIKRITAPQQMRGRGGVVFANKPKNCAFKMPSKKMSLLWNSVVLIDMSYSFNSDMVLDGTVKLSSIQKAYRGILVFD